MSYNKLTEDGYEMYFSDNYIMVKDISNKHYLRLTGQLVEHIKENKQSEQLSSFLQLIFSSKKFPVNKKIVWFKLEKLDIFEKIDNFIPRYLFDLLLMICIIITGLIIGFSSFLCNEASASSNFLFYVMWIIVNIIIHEFGHCILCINSGRSVHSIGIKLNFCIPMIYVDTSDICMSNTRNRIATSLGGIYFNSILCIFSMICYQMSASVEILMLARVSLFFVISNLLPFLKLDGYYILSDLLGEFKLNIASKKVAGNFFRRKKDKTLHDWLLVFYYILNKIFITIILSIVIYKIFIFIIFLI